MHIEFTAARDAAYARQHEPRTYVVTEERVEWRGEHASAGFSWALVVKVREEPFGFLLWQKGQPRRVGPAERRDDRGPAGGVPALREAASRAESVTL